MADEQEISIESEVTDAKAFMLIHHLSKNIVHRTEAYLLNAVVDCLGGTVMAVVGATATRCDDGIGRCVLIHGQVSPEVVCFMDFPSHNDVRTCIPRGMFGGNGRVNAADYDTRFLAH